MRLRRPLCDVVAPRHGAPPLRAARASGAALCAVLAWARRSRARDVHTPRASREQASPVRDHRRRWAWRGHLCALTCARESRCRAGARVNWLGFPILSGLARWAYAAYLIYIATHWMALMLNSRLLCRALCVLCGLLGSGFLVYSNAMAQSAAERIRRLSALVGTPL